MRRALSLGLAALLAIGAIAAIVLSLTGGDKAGPGGGLTEVRGVIGSEKQPFFRDAATAKAFEKHGLRVSVDTAGSRDIASTTDLTKYDFAFPAGTQAVPPIKRKLKSKREYGPFQTPMVIATFRDIAGVLKTAGIAEPIKDTDGHYWRFDMKAYLELVKKDTRWTDLPGNTAYPARKSLLISSTDVRTSNSAALYLAIASYVANGETIVTGATATKIAREVAPLFVRQGFTETSTEGPFEDYLAIGAGKTPMVMIYESQFLARRAAGDGSIRPGEMVLMYPQPDILTRHTLIARTPQGDDVGRLLSEDPELQRVAARYGFRPRTAGALEKYLTSKKIQPPPALVDVIVPPTYETLETMIETIETQIDAPVLNENAG